MDEFPDAEEIDKAVEEKTEQRKEDITIIDLEELPVFVSLLKAVKEVNHEVTLTFEKDMLVLKTIGKANVCLIETKILSIFFKEYNVPPSNLIIDLNDILKLMRKTPSRIKLVLTPSNELLLISVGKNIKRANIPLYTEENKVPDFPPIEYEHKFDFENETFFNIFDDISDISKKSGDPIVTQFYNKDGLLFVRSEVNKRWIEISGGFPIDKDVKVTIDATYVLALTEMSKVEDNAVVHLSTDKPLQVEWKSTNRFTTRVMIAPRAREE